MLKIRFIFILLSAILFSSFGLNDGFASSSDLVTKNQASAILPDIQILKGVVKKGDTASTLLNPYLPLKMIYKISQLSSTIFPLTRIRKGQAFKIILEGDNLVGFEYEINREDRLAVQKKKNDFYINRTPIEYDIDLEVVSSTITSSLFEAVRKSGEHCELASKLSDIFAWDIDFIRDIQPGDQFKVLVEKRYQA